VTIDGIRINGLKHTSSGSFMKRLNLEVGKSYDGIEVASAIRKVYGARNYNRIAYHWEPTTEGHATLVFDVIENPQTYLKVGLHYHTFSSISLITTLTSKNLVFDRSKTTVKLNISENFRMLLQQSQTFGKQDNNNFILSFYHERFKFPVYQNFDQTYLYRSRFTSFDARLQHTFAQHSLLGLGTAYEDFVLRPRYSGAVDVEAGNNYWHSYLYYDLITLNQKHFATSGWQISTRLGMIYHQQPDDVLYEVGEESGIIDTLSFQNYGQLRVNIQNFQPLNTKWTLLSQLNAGLNLKQGQSFLNFFNVGGLNDFLRNQVTFAGLNEYQLNTNSVAALMMGLQYNPYSNLYTTLLANIGLYDFTYEMPEAFDTGNFISGYSFTVGYASALGPIQISAMYNDQSRNFSGYVNIGFHF
jgi:NTE family protein